MLCSSDTSAQREIDAVVDTHRKLSLQSADINLHILAGPTPSLMHTPIPAHIPARLMTGAPHWLQAIVKDHFFHRGPDTLQLADRMENNGG